MVQLRNAGSLAQALDTLVQASALSSADASKLTALVQSSASEAEGDEDASLGAPDPTTYEGHSGGIIGTLEGLLEKAEAQLSSARSKETSALHNYEMLRQALEDEIKFGNKDMAEAKASSAAAAESKAVAEGELSTTQSDLAEAMKVLGELHRDCMEKAEDFEAATKSRGEELKALAEAEKVISEKTSGAESITYGLAQVSLLQVSRLQLSTGADLAKFEAVRFVRDLARKHGDAALAQLASRMASAIRFGSTAGEDPFAKVKGLISDMIGRLEASAQADASHKEYCDKQIGETQAKKEEATAQIEKLSTKIDMARTRSRRKWQTSRKSWRSWPLPRLK